MIQVQFQQLFRPLMINPSILGALITQWQLSAINLSTLTPPHNFALPQFMAPPNCEDLDPTDTPSAVPNALQASFDHIFSPKCALNLMETQCNQSQTSPY